MNLRRNAILAVGALQNINVQEEFIVDYGLDYIFRSLEHHS